LEEISVAEMGGEEHDGLNECLKELFEQSLFSMLTFVQCRILGYSELEGDYSFDLQQDDQ